MKDILFVFKDNNTQLNVESWSGRGNKFLVEILPLDHWGMINSNKIAKVLILWIKCRYSFKWYFKKISSSVKKLCHYLADNFGDEFTSAVSDVDLIFLVNKFYSNCRYDEWCLIQCISIIYSPSNFTLQVRSEIIWSGI